MPNRGSNLDILKALFDLAPEANETYNEFFGRVVIVINDDEDNWENMPEAIQLWYTGIAEELSKDGVELSSLEITDFPGVSREDYNAPAKKPASKKPRAAKKPAAKKESAEKESAEKKEPAEKKEKKEKKEKAPTGPKRKANATVIREFVYTQFGVTFADVMAHLKENELEAKESSAKIVYTSAVKDFEIIQALGKVTDKDGKVLAEVN